MTPAPCRRSFGVLKPRSSAVPDAVLCTSFGAKSLLRPVVGVGDALKLVLSGVHGGARGLGAVQALTVEVSEEVDAYQNKHSPQQRWGRFHGHIYGFVTTVTAVTTK